MPSINEDEPMMKADIPATNRSRSQHMAQGDIGSLLLTRTKVTKMNSKIMLYSPSRTLAQHRRHMENGEFSNLAKELPLARAITGQHIDKTTMVRLALSYIKLHKVIPSRARSGFDYDHCWSSNLLELMDCFLMVLDPNGDVLYVSETISIYLGLSQVFCSCYQKWSEMCSVRVKSSLTKRANKKDSLRASPGFKREIHNAGSSSEKRGSRV
ncbi:hypothetical protein NECAME_12921 [Necator americanus]|uniref:BHLH domain-containing protein n=1 Tax=Necator americanus TaxID=51031 RepID=W2SZV0_NECAM|nr:hypothetical protein NECAME_12921 [Necator americanus]ETN74541.1 hypothetical protein NECAME_12921 [Necator americanus]